MKLLIRFTENYNIGVVLILFAVTSLLVSGCDFGVTNPGRIQEKDLNTVEGMETLVTGMSADFSYIYDDIGFTGARLSDELAASGSYYLTGELRHGRIDPEDSGFYWEGVQQARFVAENGLERMQEVLGDDFDGNPLTARAYLFAGFSNRMIAENFNRDVINGGEAQPSSNTFQRAVGHFENALQQSQAAGEADFETAAYGGLAQVHVGLGNWSEAVQNAGEVPTDFVYEAKYSNNSGRESNEYRDETHSRYEASAFNTLAASRNPDDPRVPITDCSATPEDCSAEVAADGTTTMLRQEKLPDLGSDMAVVRGTEMRLIEAEAALLDDDLPTAMAKINEVRNYYGLQDTSASEIGELGGDDRSDAWDILDQERHLTLWLEGRRLHDLRRWDHYFLDGGSVVYKGVTRRASYLPISTSECDANENVECEIPYIDD
ncbi:RagB/SusD family nutrient uptake outer membrane protein [Fodinibius sp. SL11]|uniref:RagB/SusD family nutrient uptake outer membrane protein n=1 Tax=Fodinibius sp. SL11 TaxID=3425690 RepID=UPI003F885C7C